jgi:hypothetical protein
VNVTLLDVPMPLVTVIVRSPSAAVDETVSDTPNCVGLSKPTDPTVTPVPDTLTFPVVGAVGKFVPVMTANTTRLTGLLDGLMDVNVGAVVGFTVSVTGMINGELTADAALIVTLPK